MPDGFGICPVFLILLDLSDEEALADQIMDHGTRPLEDQLAVKVALAVCSNGCGIEFLLDCLHAADADLENLQLEGFLAGSGVAAQLNRLGEGNFIGDHGIGEGISVLKGHLLCGLFFNAVEFAVVGDFLICCVDGQDFLLACLVVFGMQVPDRIGICPVFLAVLKLSDEEALADQFPHLGLLPGDDQLGVKVACAVCSNGCGIELLFDCLHAADADLENLQLEGFLAGSGLAALLNRLGEGNFIGDNGLG